MTMTDPSDNTGRRDQAASDETSELPTATSGELPTPANGDPQPAPTVDDLTVVHPLGYPGVTDDKPPAEAGAGAGQAPPAGAAARAGVAAGADAPVGVGGGPQWPATPDRQNTLRQWGPSVPTVLAGMLLIAVSAGVAFLRLADTTQGPSAAAITLAVGAALIVAGLLATLAGFQRRRTT